MNINMKFWKELVALAWRWAVLIALINTDVYFGYKVVMAFKHPSFVYISFQFSAYAFFFIMTICYFRVWIHHKDLLG